LEIKNRRLEAAQAELERAEKTFEEAKVSAKKAAGAYDAFMAKMEGVPEQFWTDEQRREFGEVRSKLSSEEYLGALSRNVFDCETRVRNIKDAERDRRGLFKQIKFFDAELEKVDGELDKAYDDRSFDQLLNLQEKRKGIGAKRWAMIQTLAEVYGYEPKELEKLVSAYDFAAGKRPEEAKKEAPQ